MKIFLLALLLLGALAGQQTHVRPKTQTQAKASDSEIQSRIQAKLVKSKIARNGFRFTTSGGVVTIEGKTNVIQHKGAATRMAKAAGARAVVNKIEISEEAKAKARTKLDQGRRRAQVTRGEPR